MSSVLILAQGLSGCSFPVVLVLTLVPSGYSTPQKHAMRFTLIGYAKLPTGMNLSVNGCLFHMMWQLVQGLPQIGAGMDSSNHT